MNMILDLVVFFMVIYCATDYLILQWIIFYRNVGLPLYQLKAFISIFMCLFTIAYIVILLTGIMVKT